MMNFTSAAMPGSYNMQYNAQQAIILMFLHNNSLGDTKRHTPKEKYNGYPNNRILDNWISIGLYSECFSTRKVGWEDRYQRTRFW